jgi:hypothetical protein
MTRRERFSLWLRPIVALGDNLITLFGAALTTASGLTMIGFWALELLAGRSVSPYAGIVLFLILPGVFVAGLVLMPLGALWKRFRRRSGQASASPTRAFGAERRSRPSPPPSMSSSSPGLRTAASSTWTRRSSAARPATP